VIKRYAAQDPTIQPRSSSRPVLTHAANHGTAKEPRPGSREVTPVAAPCVGHALLHRSRNNATGSAGGSLRLLLQNAPWNFRECHRPARWIVTLVATRRANQSQQRRNHPLGKPAASKTEANKVLRL